MKASIKQISEITGFSPATISNALNHKKGVNQKTAERIFQVAKEIGYISENKITKIKLVIYKRNGLIIDDSPFFPILLKGVENECRASGYEMVICNVDRNDPDYEEQVKLLAEHIKEAEAIVVGAASGMSAALRISRSPSIPQFSTIQAGHSVRRSSRFTSAIFFPDFIKIFVPESFSPSFTG